jgi:3'-phosphoadenosine 5'-phosphosulfate sulfotransferase (PAPS reductase)/FAD synthetase
MKKIVSLSGGKDSTWMLLGPLKGGVDVDEIVFCDTGKEFPEMYEHLAKLQDVIGREITTLKDERGFDYWMFDHIKTRGKNKGKRGYGWPIISARWCTAGLKRDIVDRYLSQKYGNDYQLLVGYAFDELDRNMDKRGRNVAYPLRDARITEAQALRFCYESGFTWGGLYEHFGRVSCWCCPFKSIKELFMLYAFYPHLWLELKDMDSRSCNSFRNDHTLDELETRFLSTLTEYAA